MEIEKKGECVIDENPTQCSLRERCIFWNYQEKRCTYEKRRVGPNVERPISGVRKINENGI